MTYGFTVYLKPYKQVRSVIGFDCREKAEHAVETFVLNDLTDSDSLLRYEVYEVK